MLSPQLIKKYWPSQDLPVVISSGSPRLTRLYRPQAIPQALDEHFANERLLPLRCQEKKLRDRPFFVDGNLVPCEDEKASDWGPTAEVDCEESLDGAQVIRKMFNSVIYARDIQSLRPICKQKIKADWAVFLANSWEQWDESRQWSTINIKKEKYDHTDRSADLTHPDPTNWWPDPRSVCDNFRFEWWPRTENGAHVPSGQNARWEEYASQTNLQRAWFNRQHRR